MPPGSRFFADANNSESEAVDRLAAGVSAVRGYPNYNNSPSCFSLFFFNPDLLPLPPSLRDHVTCPRWPTPPLNPSRHPNPTVQSAAVTQRPKLAIVQSAKPTSNRSVLSPHQPVSSLSSPARADRHKTSDRTRFHTGPGRGTPPAPRQNSRARAGKHPPPKGE